MSENMKLNEILKSQDVDALLTLLKTKVKFEEIELFDILVNYLNSEEKVDSRFINTLVDNGIGIDKVSKEKQNSALILLSYLGLDEALEKFILKGFDINRTNSYGLNCFHWAVAGGQYTTAKMLIDNGADIFAKAKFEVEYYEKNLSKKRSIDRLKYLLSKEENEDTDFIFDSNLEPKIKTVKISSFSLSYNKYNPKIVKLLLEKGFNPNENVLREDVIFNFFQDEIASEYSLENNPIDKVCENNDIDVLKLMIEKGANRFDTSHLFNACKNLNFEMIKIFVEAKVNVNCTKCDSYNYGNPLSIVCSNSTITPGSRYCGSNLDIKSDEILEIIKYLVDNGADVNLESSLMAACSLEYRRFKKTHKDHNESFADVNLEIIDYLIEKGADVNFIDKKGKSILMHGINRFNGYEVAKKLIKNGSNVNYTDIDGNNVLMNLDINPDISDLYNLDETIIDEYNKEGSYDNVINIYKVIDLLIDNGLNINLKNRMGFTPLMKYSFSNFHRIVKILLEKGADITIKSEMTALDLAQNDEIKALIQKSKNNSPQKLVKLLSNFTIDKPIKFTTHTWDFGELKKEYGSFEGYMNAVKNQFRGMENELKELSSNLYDKIYIFLIEKNPDNKYSWCKKTNINIGWSSLNGLENHCNNGENPFDFKLPKPIFIGRKQLVNFGEVINLFKQEIEIRADFRNLEQIFSSQNIQLDLSASKINTRQFYTDTQKFSNALGKIFDEMKKRNDLNSIKVSTTELEDRSIEIKIIQFDSFSNKNANSMLDEVNDGDFADIKESIKNLCDWSIESSFEDECFRVNFLHSNNVKDIEPLKLKPKGFTHILRFYK